MRTTFIIGASAAAGLLLLLWELRRRNQRFNPWHKVTLIRSSAAADALACKWLSDALNASAGGREYLGLDVEWVNGSSRPAALLQISRDDETVVLQLNNIEPPPALLRLLTDDRIFKVGVG